MSIKVVENVTKNTVSYFQIFFPKKPFEKWTKLNITLAEIM